MNGQYMTGATLGGGQGNQIMQGGQNPQPRPIPSDREVIAVANILLEFRSSPAGEIEIGHMVVNALNAIRYG